MLKNSSQTEKYFEIDNFFVEKRKVALWEYGLFVIWCDFSKFDEKILQDLISLCKKEKALFIQLENIDYSWKIDLKEKKWFTQAYYKKFITPFTAIVDLEQTEEEILAKMKQKWRYNIRLAEKKWIEVKQVEKSDENIKVFFELMKETTQRDLFNWNSFSYYKEFLKGIWESELLFASYNWKIIASWIFVYCKDIAIYYYWASTSDKKYRNLMAPYLLQWKAILLWKEKKCQIYDFLWIAKPWEKNSSLAWVTDFKLKLTDDTREVSKSFIFINKKLKYKFINFFKKIRK